MVLYQEDIYEPSSDEVYPQLAEGLAMMVVPPPSRKPETEGKTPFLPKNNWEAVKRPDFREQ